MRTRTSLRSCPVASGIRYASTAHSHAIARDLDMKGYHKAFFEFSSLKEAEKYVTRKNFTDPIILTQEVGYGKALKTNYAVYYR